MVSINCIIETPKGCGAKYNYDPRLGCIELGKILPAGLVFPFDFGFIPGTKGEDGDPLDVIIISEAPAFPGCAMKCRIIGAIKATQQESDNREMRNDRYIAIPAASVLYKDTTVIQQLPAQLLSELENFFINYNQQAGKKFRPLQWVKTKTALEAIRKSQDAAEPTKLIQILLPLYDEQGRIFPEKFYRSVKKKLVDHFGGVTVYTQSPATGLWKENDENVTKDKIICYEVMVGRIDRSFWGKYKVALQKQFSQKELIIRQIETGLL